ncbi:ABC transporter permease [Kitasatospora sp. NPDC058478]|uniref:ABC transporter permease n=1 Tax=unclassified Kitasatospora TaxID=2633591 RepID=UPI003648AE29
MGTPVSPDATSEDVLATAPARATDPPPTGHDGPTGHAEHDVRDVRDVRDVQDGHDGHYLGRRRLYLRRFLRNRIAVAGVVIFLLLVLFSALGDLFTPYGYADADFSALTQAPGAEHWFGTNQGGNDVYAAAVHGLQRSLVIAVSVSVLTVAIAAVVGAGAAYFGGRVEKATLAVVHFLLIVPSFLILALVSHRLAGDWRVLILVLTVFGWMSTARVVWSVSTSLRERDYVRAAEFMGVRPLRIVVRHIIPNLGSLLIVNLTLGVVSTVLSETALSFLGFGVQTPDVSLGTMLADGAGTITSAPWLFAFPAGLTVLLTVSMTFVGDGLRDALDPTSTTAAAGGRR